MRALKVPSFLRPKGVQQTQRGPVQVIKSRIQSRFFPDQHGESGRFIGVYNPEPALVYPKDLVRPVPRPDFKSKEDMALHLHKQLARGVLLNENDFTNHCHRNTLFFMRDQLQALRAEYKSKDWHAMVDRVQVVMAGFDESDIHFEKGINQGNLRIKGVGYGGRFHYALMFDGHIYDHNYERMGLLPAEFLFGMSAHTYIKSPFVGDLMRARTSHQFQKAAAVEIEGLDSWRGRFTEPSIDSSQLYPYTRNDFHSRGMYELAWMASCFGLKEAPSFLYGMLMSEETVWGGRHSVNFVFRTVKELNRHPWFMGQIEEVLCRLALERGIRKIQVQLLEPD